MRCCKPVTVAMEPSSVSDLSLFFIIIYLLSLYLSIVQCPLIRELTWSWWTEKPFTRTCLTTSLLTSCHLWTVQSVWINAFLQYLHLKMSVQPSWFDFKVQSDIRELLDEPSIISVDDYGLKLPEFQAFDHKSMSCLPWMSGGWWWWLLTRIIDLLLLDNLYTCCIQCPCMVWAMLFFSPSTPLHAETTAVGA